MLLKTFRYFNTLKYLKSSQIFGRFIYRIKRKKTNYNKYYKLNSEDVKFRKIDLVKPIDKFQSFIAPQEFCFINIKHSFKKNIDWNHANFGKLWTYNLNYFDFINQNEIDKEDAIELIQSYIKSENALKDGKEPYPVSLRIINWLKFIYLNEVNDQEINSFIYSDLNNLADNLEYHLLGNHLLENAFSLTVGAYCFNDEKLFKKGEQLLLEQLDIQICEDGAHYELSPMYHQILLDRLLDTINFLGEEHSGPLIAYAERMLSWIDHLTFENGEIPYVNDAAPGIAPSTHELKKYAKRLGITYQSIPLKDSGYRLYKGGCYECLVDGGGLGPEYHTGHGHNDAASLLLNIGNNPVIIDTGISTYEENSRRLIEKSVISHNTSHPNGIEPSEMWRSFRVGRREKVTISEENKKFVNIKRVYPYRSKVTAIRSYTFTDNCIEIYDEFASHKSIQNYCAYFHFEPETDLILTDNTIISDLFKIMLNGVESVHIEKCLIARGYNNLIQGKKLVVQFKGTLHSKIIIQ